MKNLVLSIWFLVLWTEQALAIPVKVNPFFYKTGQFYLLCSLPFIIGAFLWYRRLITEKKRSEAEVGFLLPANRAAPLFLFLAFVILWGVSCRQNGENISEPNYPPHVLQPGTYTPTQGKVVDSDSVNKPEYVSFAGEYIPGSPPRFTPFRSLYHRAGKPRYLPGDGKVVDMTSVAPPPYIPAEGKRAPSSWPEWRPAQPTYSNDTRFHFAYLNTEHGMGADIITCLLEDRDGRIWAGAWNGGVSVWDGAGFRHFTTANGLSHDMPACLMQAEDGKIWIGSTGGGVSVWDGAGFTHFTEKEGLAGNDVRGLLQDRDGRIWIGAWDGGVSVWDGAGFTQYRKENGLSDNRITAMMKSRDGRIWIGTWNRGLNVWDGAGFTHFTNNKPRSGLSGNTINSLMESRDGRIWIGAWGGGVSVWDGAGFTHYGLEDGLSHEVVRTMTEGPDGKIWIGTQGKGVNVWDGRGFSHYTEEEGLKNSVVSSSINDSGGNILLGTWGGGIHIWNAEGFTHFSNKDGLGSNDIRCIMEDLEGRLWVGTSGEGISILHDAGFTHHFAPGNLRSNIVSALLESRDGRIWIGAWGEGVSVWDGDGFTQYKKDAGLTANNISCFMESRDGKIWIGAWGGGVNVWDKGSIAFLTTSEGLTDNTTCSLLETRDGRVWIGTAKGVSVWDGSAFTNFSEAEGLKGEFAWSLLEDEEGQVWIGGNKGINVWDGAGFTHYTTKEGLRDDNISHLCLDKQGNIWAGARKGLHRLSPKQEDGTRNLQVFINTDGLRGTSIGRMLVDREEQLWLYTTRGLDRIALPQLRADTSRPILAIRELQTFFDFNDWRKVREAIRKGEEIRTGRQQFSLKGLSFDSVQRFTNLPLRPVFPHNINQLTLRWEAIHWHAPHQLQYSYLLEGRDRFWSPLIKENKAAFQGLRPGRYTFRVRAVGGNNQWSETAVYSFVIRPPWWWTNLAKIIYLVLGAAAITGVYRYELRKKLVEQEARQLKELDKLKSRFFTNLSHEFRTPLTVISGMSAQIKRNPEQWMEKGIELIQRNSAHLLSLINQILDLRKLESDKLQLHLAQGNIVPYLKYISDSFAPMAQSQGIRIHFLTNVPELQMDYDPDKMLQILSNLLSNAIKYTSGPGDIYVQLAATEQLRPLPAAPDSYQRLILTVKDTGDGIAPEALSAIFDRFYQVNPGIYREGSPRSRGSGVGLALTKELVNLMKGEIKVDSRLGEGSTFTLIFPVTRTAPLQESTFSMKGKAAVSSSLGVFTSEETTNASVKSDAATETNSPSQAPTLLIVEDNPDVRLYLQACLKEHYRLLTADDGQEGIDLAVEQVPDLIISDVMMPVKDGLELCDALKNDERTSHIPIVLLTAKADFESRMSGLRKGADAYLAKPFQQEELLVRLEGLLALRKKLQERYRNFSAADLPPVADELEMEDAFIQKVRQIVLDHIAQKEFGIIHLCRALGVSRTQLHNKVKALTGETTSAFIRSIRLHKARELLQTTKLNVSEVGYEVGINNPSYFSRIYSEAFGEAPKDSRKA